MKTNLPLLGAAALLLLAIVSALDQITYGDWVWTVAGGSVAVGCLLLAVVFLPAGRPAPSRGLLVAVLLALGARLAVFPAPHSLSEDAARYHWDGKVLVHGMNPYSFPPSDPELSGIPSHPLDREMSASSRENPTVYPPLAEASFAVAYLLSPGRTVGLRLLWLLAEAAAWILLARELARRALPPVRLLLLAGSPLLLTTGYLPGHVDILCLPFVVLFLGAVRRRRPREAGVWLAFAVLIKPFPIILVPAVWAEFGTRRTLGFAGVMAAIVALAYAPFAGAGANLFRSTWLMARTWTFNAGLADLLALVVGGAFARILCAGLFLLLVAAAVRKGRDFLSRVLMIGGAFLVCTPFLFPWYVFFLLPVLALRPDPAILALVTLLPISDLVLIDYEANGVWEQPVWTHVVPWVCFYGLLVFARVRRRGMFADPGVEPSTSRSFA